MCHPIHRPQPHQPISSTMASSSPSSSLLTCSSRAASNPVKATPDLLSNVLRNAVHVFWHDQRRSDSAHNMIAGVWSTKIWPGTLLAPYTVTFLFDHSVGGHWVRPLLQPHVTEVTFRAVWWRETEEVPFTTAALPVALQVIPRKHGSLDQLTFDKCKFHDREQLVALSVILAKPEFIRKLSFRNCSVGLGPVGVFEALPHTELVPLWKLEFPDLTNSMIALGLSHPYRKPRIILQRLSLTVSNSQGETRMHLDHLPPLLLHLNDCRSLDIYFNCAFRELAATCRRPLGSGTGEFHFHP